MILFLFLLSLAHADYKTGGDLTVNILSDPKGYEACGSDEVKCPQFVSGFMRKGSIAVDFKKGEQTRMTTPSGLPYRQIDYYNIGDSEDCAETDPVTGKTITANLKILMAGTSKPYEQVERYLKLESRNSNGRLLNKRECFTHNNGWILEYFLQEKEAKNKKPSLQASAALCENCTSDNIGRAKDEASQVLSAVSKAEAAEQKKKFSIIARCDGAVRLGEMNVKFNMSGKMGCNVEFPDGCGPKDLKRLEKLEQIVNGVMLTGIGERTDRCAEATNGFRKQCGLASDTDLSTKDGQRRRFSEVRKKVRKALGEKKEDSITEGVLMGLFNIETTNYDPSQLNYTGCYTSTVGGRRKPLGTKADDFIFMGFLSSAHGLGQVTLETTCAVIKKFPEHYPRIKDLDKLLCASPAAKKLVEPIFIHSGESEELQILFAIDTLRYKIMEMGNSLSAGIKAYDGDDKYGNFVSFVISASTCFGPQVSDEAAYSCLLGKRASILGGASK